MEWNDVVDVLTTAAAFDRRKLAEPDFVAWQAAFVSANVHSRADAIRAVTEHYAENTDWLMPAHVIERVRAMRAIRIDRTSEADLMADFGVLRDADTGREYVETLRARTRLLGDGATCAEAVAAVPRRALTGGAA